MSEMMPFFTGPERIEVFQPIGKPMRMGDLAALAVSDRARVDEALAARDDARALGYLELIHLNQFQVIAGYCEWGLELPTAFARCLPDGAPDLGAQVAQAWRQGVAALETDDQSRRILAALGAFLGMTAAPMTVADFRARLASGDLMVLGPVVGEAEMLFQAAVATVKAGDFAGAAAQFAAYWRAVVTIHDGLAAYVTAYLSAVKCRAGQAVTERLIRESFTSLSFYEGMMALSALPPAAAAAFLAEHLRAHLSGPERDGAVEILDQGAYYLLRVDPCGSGGAQRRRATAATFPDASPFTWGRAGEVPFYCGHCALNEIILIERIGYPALVTDFTPDAACPCGWRVYKDPALIPPEFLARVAAPAPV